MIIPMDLPAGYLLMESPDKGTYLLALEIKGEQKLLEVKWFEHLPNIIECNYAICDWDLSISSPTK